MSTPVLASAEVRLTMSLVARIGADSTEAARRKPIPREKRSPITQAGHNKGRKPANKGQKLPAEPLDRRELERLMASFPRRSKLGCRNRALVAMMSGLGLKVGQVVALRRSAYDSQARTLTLPSAGRRSTSVRLPVDGATRLALDEWVAVRRDLGISAAAPLFATVSDGSVGAPVGTPYIRAMLRAQAKKVGIEKRVTPEGLRRTYDELSAEQARGIVGQLSSHIDEDSFRATSNAAYERWRDALDLFNGNPQRHATRIGHDCRDALIAFTDDLVRQRRVETDARPAQTMDKLRAVLRACEGLSTAVEELLVAYFGAASDLVQRQEHGAAKEGEALDEEDARRVLFHTMLAMYEVHHTLRRLPA